MEKLSLSLEDIERLPNHRVKSRGEWSSACPTCGGEDRFIFSVEKMAYWCRQCNLGGYVGNETQSTLSAEEIAELERKKRLARQAELEKQRTVLQKLQDKRNDLTYHRNLNGKTGYVKRKWGLTDETIDQFKVGYCHCCPTSPYSDSITIPYYQGGDLVNLRHRLGSPNGHGKYRPEIAGLPSNIFNIDSLDDGWVILVEGEFKTMVLWQYGLPAVGIPGTSFKDDWVSRFGKVERVYVTFDPGAEKQSLKAAKKLIDNDIDCRVVHCPTKPDDFFVIDGGTVGEFCGLLENAWTYEQALRGDTGRWTRRYGGAFSRLRIN
jgi:hypothetical protein